MNKRVLAVTASAFALAAMPVVGTFAKEGDVTTISDEIEITIDPSCTLGTANGQKVTKNIANGTKDEALSGSKFSVTCNDGTGWNITAVGAGAESHTTDLLSKEGDYTIPTSATIGTDASGWGFKLTGSTEASDVEETYQSFAAVPSSATKVAGGSAPVDSHEISVTYGVGVDAEQQAGTYTGKVTYVLSNGPGGPGA